jgi:RNA polymerase sigma factor (sigma-70 family)
MYDKPNELELLMARVRAGDNDAVRQVIHQYGHHILRVIRHRLKQPLRSQYDSSDVMQMVWQDFFTKCVHEQAFESMEQLVRYLAGIAKHKMLEIERRYLDTQKRDLKRRLRLDSPAISEERDLIDHRPSPEKMAADRDECDRLFAGLPPEMRKFGDMLLDGCTYTEIAAEFGWSARSVRRLVEDVRQREAPLAMR